MWFRSLQRQKVGQPITARTLRQLAEVAEWSTRIKAMPPLSIMSTAAGPIIRIDSAQKTDWLAITNGAISANVVVTAGVKWTPGSGTVYAVTFDGTHWNTDTSVDYDVINFSTTTAGIATGVLVWIGEDEWGNNVITAVDCGN